MRRFLAAALLLCPTLAAAEKKPVTLEAIKAQRFPSMPGAPVWAPDGKRFVYTERGQLWLYDVPAKSKLMLLPLDSLSKAAVKMPEPERFAFENRGVREETVQWFPSGDRLLLVGGGDIFVFRLGAGGWIQLTATPEAERDPKISPDGSRVSFRRGHDLYVMEIRGRKVTRLTDDGSPTLLNAELDWVYPEELDLGTAHWWAPDSKSIAYLQFDISREPVYPQTDLTGIRAALEPERYPKPGDPNADVRMGIVPVGGGRTLWVDLGQTRDTLRARFNWLPDSSGVMVQRLNRIQNRLDLLLADAKTGDSRTVLTETDPYWVNVHDEFRFLKNGKEFIWPSERDGFNHLYRYSIDGKLIGRITSGEWEVSSLACLDEPGGRIYYVSTEASPLERQLYRISLDGNDKKRLTENAGTHSVSMGPGCGYYLDSFSNLTQPPGRTIYRADGAEWTVFAAPDRKQLDEYVQLPSEIVTLKAADGATLYGRLIKPAGFDGSKKYPVLVNVYGGPHAQTVQNHWTGVVNTDQMMAQRGYVIWSLDNRGSAGRGHKFETAVFRNLGAKELEDQKEGVRYLFAQGFVDPARVAVTGWSYGGFMTVYSLLHAPEVFSCGVAGAAVTDWRTYDSIYTERYMGLPSENSGGYESSSVVSAAAKLKGKLLLVHNLEDDNVLFQNAVRLVSALQQANRPFEFMPYTNKSHGLMRGRQHFTELSTGFFDRCLK